MSVKDYDQCFAFLVDMYQALFSSFFSRYLKEVNVHTNSLNGLDAYQVMEKFFSWLAAERVRAEEVKDEVLWWYLDFMTTWGPLVITTRTAIRNNDSELLLDCYKVALQLFYMTGKRNYVHFSLAHLYLMATINKHDRAIIQENRFASIRGRPGHSIARDCLHEVTINREMAQAMGNRAVSVESAIHLSNTLSMLTKIGKVAAAEMDIKGHGHSYTVPSNSVAVGQLERAIVEEKLAVLVPRRLVDVAMRRWEYPKTLITSTKQQLSMAFNRYHTLDSFVQRFLGTPTVSSISPLFKEHSFYLKQGKFAKTYQSGYFCLGETCPRSLYNQQEPAYKTWRGIDEHNRLKHPESRETITEEQWCHAMCQMLEDYYIKVDGVDEHPPEAVTTVEELERCGYHRFVDVNSILVKYQLSIHNQPEIHKGNASTELPTPPRCQPPSLDDLGDEADELHATNALDWVCE